MNVIEAIFWIWIGGVVQSILWTICARSWSRVGAYGCIFLAIYWLPLAVDATAKAILRKNE